MSKFKDMVFAIDFDGTCVMHEFPNVGADVPKAVETLRWIVEQGGKLVLNTMRSDHAEGSYLLDACLWFKRHQLPLYGINFNPTQSAWTSSPKVFADVYIDDAAVGCPLIVPKDRRPYVNWLFVRDYLELMGTDSKIFIHQPFSKPE